MGKASGLKAYRKGNCAGFGAWCKDSERPEYYVGCFKSKSELGVADDEVRGTRRRRDVENGEEDTRSVCLHSRTRSSLRTFGCGRGRCSTRLSGQQGEVGAGERLFGERGISTRTAWVVDFTSIGGNTGACVGGGSAKKRTREENNEEEKIKDDKEAKMKEEKTSLRNLKTPWKQCQ